MKVPVKPVKSCICFNISIGCSNLSPSSSSQQYPLNITYFKDDEDGQITTQIVNAQTNTDIIQSLNLESVDKIGFSYDVQP